MTREDATQFINILELSDHFTPEMVIERFYNDSSKEALEFELDLAWDELDYYYNFDCSDCHELNCHTCENTQWRDEGRDRLKRIATDNGLKVPSDNFVKHLNDTRGGLAH